MKKCAKCGTDILDEALICPNCGCPVERDDSQCYKMPQTDEPLSSAPINNRTVYNAYKPTVLQKKNIKPSLSLIIDVIGVIIGVITAIIGFNFKNHISFSYTDMITYGGDAYTGIQNASANAANNIAILGSIAIKAVSIFFVIFGILIALCFIIKIIKEIKLKKQ